MQHSVSRITGEALANKYIATRFDKSTEQAACNPRYGWERGAKGCVRSKRGMNQAKTAAIAASGSAAVVAGAVSVLSKDKNIKVAAGATGVLLGGIALALPLMELQGQDPSSTAPLIPTEGISDEALMGYNKKFKKGDLVRHKFKLPTGADAFHYGVYMGANPKDGEPQILHINPTTSGKGAGIMITSMRPRVTLGVYEYEKAPQRKKRNIDFEKRLEAIEPYIGKSIDFNIFDQNCEAFARMFVENTNKSYQTARMSRLGRTIGRTVYGTPISIITAKGHKNEVTFKEVEQALNEQLKQEYLKKRRNRKTRTDSETGQQSYLPDWRMYINSKGGSATVKTPAEMIEAVNLYDPSLPLDEVKVAILKGYFLFLAATAYVKEQKMGQEE